MAKKIIELEKLSSFVLIYYYSGNSEKIKYYYDQIAPLAAKAFYIEKNNKLPHTFKTLVRLFFSVRRYLRQPLTVYTGNVKSMYSRFIIFATKARTLHTFDDGVGNVCGEGYFYEHLNPSASSRFLSSVGLSLSYSAMYSRIKKHYTIYKAPNVMPFCTPISLFDFDPARKAGDELPEVSVLLTSALYEYGFADLETEKKLYWKIIKDFNVKYVIAHPLEIYDKFEGQNVTILKSKKIAEEIIMDLRNDYGHIKVIAWYSSVLIHLSSISGVEAINVHFDENLTLGKTKAFFESFNIKMYIPELK